MYYVMRTYSSHAAKTQLIKVCSRAFKRKQDAENWKDFCESEEKDKEHTFFIIQSDEYI